MKIGTVAAATPQQDVKSPPAFGDLVRHRLRRSRSTFSCDWTAL
jgi:hypothetical protein